MHNNHFLEQYANETLTDARDFMARERLARLGGTLEPGEGPNWLLAGVVLIGIVVLMIVM